MERDDGFAIFRSGGSRPGALSQPQRPRSKPAFCLSMEVRVVVLLLAACGCAASLLASLYEPAVGNSFGLSRALLIVSTLAPRFSSFESVAVRVFVLPSAACGCVASRLASLYEPAVGNSFGSPRARLFLSALAPRSSCF